MPVFIAQHPHIDGVECIYASESALNEDNTSWPRPYIAIIGSMHGNEPCGRLALEALAERTRLGELPVQEGTLFLIHGNPAASKTGKRHTEGGADLNRLFSYDFIANLPKSQWSSEHHRAIELRPLLQELDAVLDLHSASAPTPPFGIVSTAKTSPDLGRKLGLPYLTHGWNGPGLLGDQVLLHVLTQRGKPSFAVECGQHDDPISTQRAHETANHFLVATGILPPNAAPALPEQPPVELNIVDAVKKPSPGFQFHQRLIGLQQIPAGAIIGSDENLEIHCKRTSFAIMPNAAVETGQDMLYLAHQITPNTLL